MTPKLQHSEKRTDWVAGRVARQHGDIGRDRLRQIVADALESALFFDHDQLNPNRPHGRADSVPAGGSIRADGGNPMKNKQTRDPKRDAADKQRARQDAALAEIRNAHTKSRGYTRADAQASSPSDPNPAPAAGTARESMADSIRNAHKQRGA